MVEYLATPNLTGKTLLLCVPMIATGTTLSTVYELLNTNYKIRQLHVIAVIESTEEIAHITEKLPKTAHAMNRNRELNVNINSRNFIFKIPAILRGQLVTMVKKELL